MNSRNDNNDDIGGNDSTTSGNWMIMSHSECKIEMKIFRNFTKEANLA